MDEIKRAEALLEICKYWKHQLKDDPLNLPRVIREIELIAGNFPNLYVSLNSLQNHLYFLLEHTEELQKKELQKQQGILDRLAGKEAGLANE